LAATVGTSVTGSGDGELAVFKLVLAFVDLLKGVLVTSNRGSLVALVDLTGDRLGDSILFCTDIT